MKIDNCWVFCFLIYEVDYFIYVVLIFCVYGYFYSIDFNVFLSGFNIKCIF